METRRKLTTWSPPLVLSRPVGKVETAPAVVNLVTIGVSDDEHRRTSLARVVHGLPPCGSPRRFRRDESLHLKDGGDPPGPIV